MSDRMIGFIRFCKPERGWGICHAYGVDNVLSKYFVHTSNFPNVAALASGMHISFTIGAPRCPGELPIALDIKLFYEADVPVALAVTPNPEVRS
jgi:hypothetical protein